MNKRITRERTGQHHLPFHRNSVLILLDSLNALFKGQQTMIGAEAFTEVETSYRELFARATATFQKAIYLGSASAKFWSIPESKEFDRASQHISTLACAAGVWVMGSETLLENLTTCRRAADHWHFACVRQQDYGAVHLCNASFTA